MDVKGNERWVGMSWARAGVALETITILNLQQLEVSTERIMDFYINFFPM